MSNPQKSATVRVEAIGDGLGIHDWQRGTSFVLNATTCLVWQHCDGRTTPRQLAGLLQRAFNVSPAHAEELLELALAELDDADLLQRGEPLLPRPSRRQVIKGLTAVGLSVILLPVVSPVSTALAGPTTAPSTTTRGATTAPSTTTAARRTTTAPPPTTTNAPPTTPRPTTAPFTTTAAPPTTTTAGPRTTTAPLTTTTTTTAAPTGGTGTGTGGGSETPEAPAGVLLALGLAPLASLTAWRRRWQQRPRADD